MHRGKDPRSEERIHTTPPDCPCLISIYPQLHSTTEL